MNWFASVNFIHLFDFYLAAMFVVGTYRRIAQYQAFAGLALGMPGRWPHLFRLVKQFRTIFLTWNTVLPSILALVIWIIQVLASRLVWHQAVLTGTDLFSHRKAWVFVVPAGIAMLAVDFYFLIVVGEIDRTGIEKNFDQAEHWLSSWHAPAVRMLSFGYVNPRRMVHDEVRQALVSASDLLNRSLYWTCTQMGLRVLFGLGLWFTWAFA
ncbi:MAG TPA: hypothetical protein VH120_19505 [Gemmataceae bacterium]|jgi:hypothetical protein|nr:hypothetical protein [Gemmataceae bacterium]